MSLVRLEKACRAIAHVGAIEASYSEAARSIMGIVREVVPCDTINMGTVDLETEEGFHFALDGFLMPPDRRALLPRFKHQHPMLEYARRNGTNPPLRFTDLVPRREFEERGIFRECYRGFTRAMLSFGIASPPGMNISFVLSRESGDFTDQNRRSLNILQPLVSSTLQQIVSHAAIHEARRRRCPVGIIHGTGEFVHTMDVHALDLLQKHYPRLSRHRLPSDLLRAVSIDPCKVVTLRSNSDSSRLCGRIAPKAEAWSLQLWEETSILSVPRLTVEGLTGRQIDVVQWLAKGKTNGEIALILGISYRTVQKHLEVIYRRLGVETRLAAVGRCRELCG